MVVDDSEEIRFIVRRILEEAGYSVSEAADGEECLQMLYQGEKPDLILLDVMMPKMDGWGLSRKIKQDPSLQHIPICMLTAKTSTMDALMSLESARANWHLNKPINRKQLLDTVRWLIENPSQ
ncbi:MAG: response regulator [Methanobacteriota archaeon]|nr:MAG: response regulator [Euryarchaeota archaeon]